MSSPLLSTFEDLVCYEQFRRLQRGTSSELLELASRDGHGDDHRKVIFKKIKDEWKKSQTFENCEPLQFAGNQIRGELRNKVDLKDEEVSV
ncbi:hypothetical protein L596_001553 [Steinernema carpocapsae]|uniref:Uncharacterized protein n=1 Tax=Steinernema carpocapsae TaxID=34508 RepID=A0A4U8ULT4_STECR|nr:hypothetical protein L596_001553 [Steinernema carpocapsae]